MQFLLQEDMTDVEQDVVILAVVVFVMIAFEITSVTEIMVMTIVMVIEIGFPVGVVIEIGTSVVEVDLVKEDMALVQIMTGMATEEEMMLLLQVFIYT